jgi:hypothetical protein
MAANYGEYQSHQPPELNAASKALTDRVSQVAQLDPLKVGTSMTGSTTDATATTLGTVTPADGKVTTVVAEIYGYRDTGAEAASYFVALTVRRSGATVTAIGTATALHTAEDVAGWAGTLDVSGTTVRVRVTGAASSNVAWSAFVTQRPNG